MKTKTLTLFAVLFALAAAAPAAVQAEPAPSKDYSFDVPAKLVVISFESRMEIEDILGTTRAVKGHARLAENGAGSFAVEVPVDSLRTGIEMRDDHLRSETWLDADKYPTIKMEGSTIRHLKGTRHEVSGTFTLRGVSRPLTVEVDLRRIPSEKASKLGLGDGDWLRVRGEFPVKLSDHGVKIPAKAVTKVSDSWTVKVSLFGMSPTTPAAQR